MSIGRAETSAAISEGVTAYVKAPAYQKVIADARKLVADESIAFLVVKAFEAGVRWKEAREGAS